MSELPIPHHEPLAAIFFGVFALTYTLYYYSTRSEKLRSRFEDRFGFDRGSVLLVLFQRSIMIVGAGIIPSVAAFAGGTGIERYGFRFVGSWQVALAALGMMALSAAISIFAAKPEEKLAAYPQIRKRDWSLGTVAINSISWALYLLAYELTFRGFLFVILLPYGLWTSIAVNTALYVAVHVPKGASEAAGAFAYGPVLCLLTLWSGTIWIAVLAHIALALGNSYSCLAANRDMRIVR